MNEKIKERARKVKAHFQRNKKTYVVSAWTAVVAVLGTLVVTQRTRVDISAQRMGSLLYKPTQTIDIHIEALGHPGYIVQDLETGTAYASQAQAAKALGVEPVAVSRHLNGHTEHVAGKKLVRLGKAPVAE